MLVTLLSICKSVCNARKHDAINEAEMQQHVSQVAVLLHSSATIKSSIVPEGSSTTKGSFAKDFYQRTMSTFSHF